MTVPSLANGFLNISSAIAMMPNLRKLSLKGGNNQMETKSRYEVIAELEGKKANLIREKEGFDNVLVQKKRELKELTREVEDKEEEIANFEKSMATSKNTITELIASIDDSLKRFSDLGKKA